MYTYLLKLLLVEIGGKMTWAGGIPGVDGPDVLFVIDTGGNGLLGHESADPSPPPYSSLRP